jgi:Lrp/AsnC family transcriptional regulator, leucine-responsive regulatory protein
MNRSLYLNRQIDQVDRSIIAALTEEGRMTTKAVAEKIGMSSPSVTARVNKMKDANAITGFAVVIDPKAFGLHVEAHVRIHALPGEGNRVVQMLRDTPEVVLADQITGKDCFQVKIVVSDAEELHSVVAPFEPYASVDAAIIMANVVSRRLPAL